MLSKNFKFNLYKVISVETVPAWKGVFGPSLGSVDGRVVTLVGIGVPELAKRSDAITEDVLTRRPLPIDPASIIEIPEDYRSVDGRIKFLNDPETTFTRSVGGITTGVVFVSNNDGRQLVIKPTELRQMYAEMILESVPGITTVEKILVSEENNKEIYNVIIEKLKELEKSEIEEFQNVIELILDDLDTSKEEIKKYLKGKGIDENNLDPIDLHSVTRFLNSYDEDDLEELKELYGHRNCLNLENHQKLCDVLPLMTRDSSKLMTTYENWKHLYPKGLAIRVSACIKEAQDWRDAELNDVKIENVKQFLDQVAKILGVDVLLGPDGYDRFPKERLYEFSDGVGYVDVKRFNKGNIMLRIINEEGVREEVLIPIDNALPRGIYLKMKIISTDDRLHLETIIKYLRSFLNESNLNWLGTLLQPDDFTEINLNYLRFKMVELILKLPEIFDERKISEIENNLMKSFPAEDIEEYSLFVKDMLMYVNRSKSLYINCENEEDPEIDVIYNLMYRLCSLHGRLEKYEIFGEVKPPEPRPTAKSKCECCAIQ